MNKPQLLTLKVLALKKDSGETIRLPDLTAWKGEDYIELCNTINSLDYNLKKEKFKLSGLEPSIRKFTECGGGDIHIYADLPVDYLVLYKKIILRDESCFNTSLSAVLPGLAKKSIWENEITEEKYKKPCTYNEGTLNNEGILNKIQNIAFYNIYGASDYTDVKNTNSNVIAYEFLQNADDSKRRNRTGNDKIGNDFKVTEQGNSILLEYSEAGFSAWDFYCITTKGNSGNKNYEQNTGRYGTGFKSIYAICTSVEIFSKDIVCILNTKCIPRSDNEEIESINNKNDNAKKRNQNSPVPYFCQFGNGKSNENESNITKINLIFQSEKNKENFLNELYNPYNYVFLKNITYPGTQDTSILSGKAEDSNYFCYWENENPCENEKPLLELYFPPLNEDGSVTQHHIYCNLPMNGTKKYPFLINIPQIIPTEDRQNFDLHFHTTGNSNSDYNKELLNKIREPELFKKAFEAFAEKNKEIAYKYILPVIDDINLFGNVADYKIFPYYNGKHEIKLCSMNQLKNGEIKILTNGLYGWLENHEGASSFNYLLNIEEIKRKIGKEYETLLDTCSAYDNDELVKESLSHIRRKMYTLDNGSLISEEDELFMAFLKHPEKLVCFSQERESIDFVERMCSAGKEYSKEYYELLMSVINKYKYHTFIINESVFKFSAIRKELFKKDNVIFKFHAKPRKLNESDELSNIFITTVDEETRNRITAEYSLFAEDSADSRKAVCFYQTDLPIYGYVNGTVNESENFIVIIHNNSNKKIAFGNFLKEKCDCTTFSVFRKYKPMESFPADDFDGFMGYELLKNSGAANSLPLKDLRKQALEIYKNNKKDSFIDTFQFEHNGEWYDFKGYGCSDENERACCPICKGNVLIESDVMKCRNILVNEKLFPLLLCANCYNALDYVKSVNFYVDSTKDIREMKTEEYTDYLCREDATASLELILANATKKETINLSFFHKLLLPYGNKETSEE